MNEYPIPIAEAESDWEWRLTSGELMKFKWDLNNVSEGIYQLRALSQNIDEVLGTQTYHISKVMMDFRSRYLNRATFQMSDQTSHYLSQIIPAEEEVHFMLRVFALSSPYYDDGRMLDFCEDCDVAVPLHEDEGHGACATCGDIFPEAVMEYFEVHGMEAYNTMICSSCTQGGYSVEDIDDVVRCLDCEECHWTENEEIYYRNVRGRGEGYFCDYCMDQYYYCEDCDQYGTSDCFSEDEYGTMLCDECLPQIDERLIKEWNYRPEMIFHPAIPKDPLKPLYIGMELEIQWDNYYDEANEWLNRMVDEYGEMLYFKSDSSVDQGFELVTHPLSPEYALENFPFHELQVAIDEGAEERHHSTGVHIHIDRGALTTAQMWKFLKVHKTQRELCGIVGGRGTKTDYANWDNNFTPVTENMFSIARKKGEAFGGAARYVPVNLQNEDTIELRYMEGTINPEEIRKNIQWVQALYDFTDHISVEDVKNGVLDSPGYLLGWIMDQQALYPSLAGYLSKRLMAPKVMPVRSSVCA